MVVHSIIAPDGSQSYVPSEQVPAAIRAGGKPAQPVQAPDGSIWHIPFDRVADAVKAGGRMLSDSADTLEREGKAAASSVVNAPGRMNRTLPLGELAKGTARVVAHGAGLGTGYGIAKALEGKTQ